jgi:hypothetical protein
LGLAGTWAVASHLLPPGQPFTVSTSLALLGVTGVLAATLHRWLLPVLRAHLGTWTPRGRGLWLLGCLAVAWLLLRALPLNAPMPAASGTLTVTATGQRSAQALGSELWVVQLWGGDGQPLSQEAWEPSGEWERKDGQAWLSHRQQPASLRWHGWAPGPLSLEVVSHPQSGIMRYEWNGETREVDLYSPAWKQLRLELPLPVPSRNTFAARAGRLLFHASHVMVLATVLLTLGLWLAQREGPSPATRLPSRRERLLYALPALVSGVLWLLATFPGLLSSDSTDQWNQALTARFNDAHPVFHTFLIRMLSRLWETPAAIAVAQILTLGALVSWGCASLQQAGVPRLAVWVTALGMGLTPVNGTLINTVWKDIPFSLGVLALGILLFRALELPNETRRGRFWGLLVGVSIVVMLTRHNGPPAVFGTFLALLLLIPRQWKLLVTYFCVMLALAMGIRQTLLRTYQAPVVESGMTLIGYLSAHVAAETPMSREELALLEELHPLEGRWNYVCFSIVPTAFDGRFDMQALGRHKKALLPLFLELTRRNPKVTLNHVACTTGMIWKLGQGNDLTNGPFILENPPGRLVTVHEIPGAPRFEPVFPELGQRMLRLVVRTLDRDVSWLFWRPAVPLYLVFLACALLSVRRRSWRPAVLLLPLVLHTLALALIINSQDMRYQYPVFLVSQMFCLGWLLLPRRAAAQALPEAGDPAASAPPAEPEAPAPKVANL